MESAKTALKFKDNKQPEALTEHDARFHPLVARISGNQSVLAVFERIHCHLFRLFLATQNHVIDDETRSKFVQDLFQRYYRSDFGQLATKQHAGITNTIIK